MRFVRFARWWIQVGLAAAWAATLATPSNAETRALIVAVSTYPSLVAKLQLDGPRQDARLFRKAIALRGVRSIRILADGVDDANGLPTLREIRREITRLISESRPGDNAIVYFAGHGSQQPVGSIAPDLGEADGYDEIFLPRDIGRWDGSRKTVVNALTDNEIGTFLDAFEKKQVNVWAVFDTCHASSMARNASGPDTSPAARLRAVAPVELGVPPSLRTRPNLSARIPGRVVAFFASREDEPTIEEPLLATGQPKRRYMGLFTHHLLSSLSPPGVNQTFRDLMQSIQRRYQSEKRVFPTPAMEGPVGRYLPF